MSTKTLTPAQKGAITRKRNIQQRATEAIAEAKRQATHVPVSIVAAEDDGGSHSIDHGTILDNHVEPDTNKEGQEIIDERNAADLSFWNNSWTWAKAKNSYGTEPKDAWFVNPTPKLVGEVLSNVPTIYEACRVTLTVGTHMQQLKDEQERHLEFLRAAHSGELISESLDLLKSYQGRFIESVQRYIGLTASYHNQRDARKPDATRLEAAKLKKKEAGNQCRGWSARLIALVEAYHSVVTDERAYNLTFNFSPLPPVDGKPASREYGILKWAITTTLNKVGRQLGTSIKSGKMDAEKFRIPRPWLTEAQTVNQLSADDMISDFD